MTEDSTPTPPESFADRITDATFRKDRTGVTSAVTEYNEHLKPELEKTLATIKAAKDPKNTDLTEEQLTTALHSASTAGTPEDIAAVLSTGINVDTPNENGASAVHLAVFAEKPDNLNFLLDNDANPNTALTRSKATPLHIAHIMGNEAIQQALISKGANEDAKDNSGKSPAELSKGIADATATPAADDRVRAIVLDELRKLLQPYLDRGDEKEVG